MSDYSGTIENIIDRAKDLLNEVFKSSSLTFIKDYFN